MTCTKETLIKLSAVWDLKACSGTPLCLMMHTRAMYRYDESCVKTFCKLHTCNTSSLTVTQRVSNLILASKPPHMAMVSITQHKPIGGLQETSHERARQIVKLNHCSPRLTYFL